VDPRAPAEQTLAPGAVVGNRLRVVRTLGVGGMGTVYEVEHELTKHHRALKVLHAKAAQQSSVVERFVREASAAGRIANVHIAETFDAGRLESGEPYLLMELLEGETLDARLHRAGAIELGELTDLIHQSCEGVHAAHVSGIVHRDLKPENLFITARDGLPFVKILDFGISKFDSERTGIPKITTEGLVLGTPYYMSPEQLVASPSLDARTDVYSLGVILYECACGERPYDGKSLEHLAILISQGRAAPLESRKPELPAGFCAAVHRAMSADLDARFGTARELAEAIAPFRTPAAIARVVSWSVPPARVVIHTSAPPARASGSTPATTTASGIAMGLAETKATHRPADAAAAAPGWKRISAIAAASAAVAVAIAIAVIAWSTTGPSRVADPPRAIGAAASSWPEPSPVAHAPPSTEVARKPPVADASAAAASSAAAATRPSPAPAEGSPSPSRSARPLSKSRVDEQGLAGENPFR
jgi:serine/threonine-protein kinase